MNPEQIAEQVPLAEHQHTEWGRSSQGFIDAFTEGTKAQCLLTVQWMIEQGWRKVPSEEAFCQMAETVEDATELYMWLLAYGGAAP